MGYILVNPKIGDSSIKSKNKNSIQAAEEIWSQLSSNIKHYTPKFYFTIQEAGSSKLSHFVIKETLEDSRVKYNLKEFKGKKIDEKSFINEMKQEGGKKHKHKYRDNDDSSSSSSSSSSEVVFTFPAGTSHKNTLITYYPTIYGVPNIILPTFVNPFLNVRLIPNNLIIIPPYR
jgi:hypothetical protein